MVLSRKRVTWGDGWVWPVPSLVIRGRTYHPVITSGFADMRAGEPHGGVDIVYPRRDLKDLVDVFPPGTPNGGKLWFAPPRVPVLAARAGDLWSMQKTDHGWAAVLDHHTPWASFYQHMESPAYPLHKGGKSTVTGTPTHVNAGDIIGVMGFSPIDPERVRHLHFAPLYEGGIDDSVDPEEAMRSWPVVRSVTLNV